VAGAEGFTWDRDGSYADWYGGHEIAHTFGRRHPGFCGNPVQRRHDTSYPYPQGFIGSGADENYGLDAGSEMAVLTPTAWHDVMSYCANLWVSAYTYRGLADRFALEDKLLLAGELGGVPSLAEGAALSEPPVPGAAAGRSGSDEVQPEPWLNVIARFGDVDRNDVEIRRVVEVSTPPPVARDSGRAAVHETEWVEIRLIGAARTDLGVHLAPLLIDEVEPHPDPEAGPPPPRTGMVNAIVPNPNGLQRLEIARAGRVIAAYAATQPDIRTVSVNSTAGAPVAGSDDRQFSWGLARGGGTPTYFVQMSYDGGLSWLTIDQRQHASIVLPSDFFEGRDTARLRVLAVVGTSREVLFTSDELVRQP
jgi:hypothetical protein